MMLLEFKLWVEATIDPKQIKDIKASLEKDGYADVTMTANGEVLGPTDGLDWYRNKASDFDRRRSLNMTALQGDGYKKISVHTYGGLVKPQSKELMQALRDSGVIDDTWEFNPRFTQPGEYIGSTYQKFQGGMHGENPTVGGVLKNPAMSKDVSSENLILWHGTSEKDWEQIQKDGALHPLFQGSNQQYGFESRAKHEHNKDHLYLASNENIAWDYAKQRARDQNRKADPDGWQYNQHHGADRWPIKPVLLKVKIPEVANLRADDDAVNDILRNVGDKIWAAKSQQEREELARYLEKKTGYDLKDPSIAKMIWREDDDTGWPEIQAKIPARAYKAWLASIYRKGHVAYKGSIPLSNIQEVPFIPRGD